MTTASPRFLNAIAEDAKRGRGDRSALAAMSIPFMFFARFLLIQRHVMNVANEELLGKAKDSTAAVVMRVIMIMKTQY